MYLKELDDDEISEKIAYLDVAITNYVERRKVIDVLSIAIPSMVCAAFIIILYWR